ncbi:MAG: hypothetical protein HY293_11240 [Planctomycetes bacterium]|nr:hypothetical protein [Planctomycetota bacterium]
MAKKPARSKPKAKPKPAAKKPSSGAAQAFLSAYEKEYPITVRLLNAYPADKLDLKPHAKCKTARELAWMFVVEQGATMTALTTGFDFSKPFAPPPAPATMGEILGAFEQGYRKVVGIVKGMSDEQLGQKTKFMVGPKAIGDLPKLSLAWLFLCDQIHHRGQFSIYLRMADAKVPSIYGPTADEPWN